MLYTESDEPWNARDFMKNLRYADRIVKKKDWNAILLSLVNDNDAIVCTGLSMGVFVELGFLRWSYEEGRSKVKMVVGIKELLRKGTFPPEITFDLKNLLKICPVRKLKNCLMV